MGEEGMRAFTVAEAARHGIGLGRLRNRDFARPFHGVRVAGGFDPDDVRARCRALASRMEAGQVFSHQTAALLHGFPLPASLARTDADLHVSVFEPDRAPQLRGVRSHELKPTGQRIVRVDGLAVIGVEDTWTQLSASASVEDLIVAADWLITGDEPYSGDPPPTTLDELDRAIARRGRMRGVRALRRARDSSRYGPLSPQETRLRLVLAEALLPEPALNHRVTDDEGSLVAMVDIAYPEYRIAIEYLGDHHRTTTGVYRDDILRRERLADRGWSVLYTTAHDVASPAFLIVRLRRLLASTGKSL